MPYAWAVLWVGGAIFQALPGQNTGAAVAGTILGGPGWLGRVDASVARWTTHHGTFVVVAWVVAQDVGQLYTGQATDPNSGLIIAVMAIAILGARRARVGARVRARGVHRTGLVARRDLESGQEARF